MSIENLIAEVKSAADEVWKVLGSGFLENVYKKAFVQELKLRVIECREEVEVDIFYKGINVGIYKIDLLVDNRLIVELKATTDVSRVHSVQLVNYLSATGIDNGLLINFCGSNLYKIEKTRLYNK